jgi:hypothetical protein
MPLPTMSLRAPPEHHQLIRDIATALRTRPELASVLRNVLQPQYSVAERDTVALQTQHDISDSDTDVLQAFQTRLMIQSEGLQRVMAFVENINERVKVLERSAGTNEETGTANGSP